MEEKKQKKNIILNILAISLIIIFALLVVTLIFFNGGLGNQKKDSIIKYLNNKYGDGDWKIVKEEKLEIENHEEVLFRSKYASNGDRYTISTSYLDGGCFNIHDYSAQTQTEITGLDGFLPTYYSIKYDLKYVMNTSTKAKYSNDDDFSELSERLEYVFDYLYPYTDSKYYGEGLDSLGKYDSRKMFDTSFLPNYQRIPEFSEWINDIGEHYSGKRQKESRWSFE